MHYLRFINTIHAAWHNRRDPACARVVTTYIWRLFLALALSIIVGFWSMALYMTAFGSLEDQVKVDGVVPPKTVDESKLKATLSQFAERIDKNQKLIGTPVPVVDPAMPKAVEKAGKK